MRVSSQLSLALLLLAGCGEETGFEAQFVWENEPPPRVCDDVRVGQACTTDADCRQRPDGAGRCVDNRLFVVAELLDPPGGACRESIIRSEPQEYRSGSNDDVEFDLEGIPLGRPFVVAVELRRFQSVRARVLYYGISQPFTIREGRDTRVEIRISLTPAPGTVPDPSETFPLVLPEVVIPPDPQDDRRYVRSSTVTLELTMSGATRVEISNLPFDENQPCGELGEAVADAILSEAAVKAGTSSTREVEWNLDAGTGRSPCGLDNSCPRRVFVRFRDEEGYPSPIFSQEVVVDSRKPQVVDEVTSLQLIPQETNVLLRQNLRERITKAAAGTRIQLTLSIDEPVLGEQPLPPAAEEPSVTAIGPTGETLSLARDRRFSGFVYTATVTPTTPEVEGTYVFQVTATDRARNVGVSVVGTPFVVDRSSPAGPALDPAPESRRRAVYLREPYRPGPSGSFEPYFAIRGGEGVVEANATVLVLDGPDPETASRIAVVFADERGSLPETQLVSGDLGRIYLLEVDEAGNPSSSVHDIDRAHLVRDVTWTGSFAGRIPRSTLGNPHVFETRRWFLDVLRQGDAEERGAADGIATEEGSGPSLEGWVTTSGGGSWRSPEPIAAPPRRFWGGASRDVASGRILFYGGRVDSFGSCDETGNESCGGVWSFNGGRFERVAAAGMAGTPVARSRHAQVYDSRRDELVVFAGRGRPGCTDPDSNNCGDTWVFDRTNGWTERNPPGPTPARRHRHAMAYDAARSETILFGGIENAGEVCDSDGEDQFCSATWKWDGEAWTVAVAASSTAPAPTSRRGHSMAYDPVREQIVLFGGQPALGETCDGESDYCRDTWLWDGTGWTQAGQGALQPQPSGREDSSMAFSPEHGGVVLFGGDSGPGNTCDGGDRWCDALWSWTGQAWERLEPAFANLPKPVGRSGHSMEVDPTGRLIVFGGRRVLDDRLGSNRGDCTSGQTALCTGVWAFQEVPGVEGSRGFWSELTGFFAAREPSPREEHGMAHASGLGLTVLFGGEGNFPPFAGITFGDTWLWNGFYWTEDLREPSPSPRDGHHLYWDEAISRLTSVGGKFERLPFCDGALYCGPFWQYEPRAGWTMSTERLGPPEQGLPEPRADFGMAFDASRRRLILAGGVRLGGAELADAFMYEGSTWVPSPTAPSERRGVTMTWNSSEDLAVAFGGELRFELPFEASDCPVGTSPIDRGVIPACYRGDTWIWHPGTETWTVNLPHDPTALDRPSPRSQATLVYVPEREEALLFAGLGPDCPSSDQCNDLWALRSGSWREIEPSDIFGHGLPTARGRHAAAYDSDRRQMVVFGGRSGLNDTWVWHPAIEAKPAHVARFRFGRAFIDPDARQDSDLSRAKLLGATMVWQTDEDDLAEVDYDLLLWHRGQWRRSFEASGGGLEAGVWETTNGDLLREMVTGADGELGFALTPREARPERDLQVSTDRVELTVRYRLPDE